MSEVGQVHPFWASDVIERAIAGLRHNTGLPAEPAQRLRRAIEKPEHYAARAQIGSQAQTPQMKWIVSGWACEMRVLSDSRRQIFSFLLPGDVLISRPTRQQHVCAQVALTKLECADAGEALQNLPESDRPALWDAMIAAQTLNQDRKYDHMVRLGQYSAPRRVADLLLELHERLAAIGLVSGERFRLPLTQEHLADALGLSIVHVNRTLRELRAQRLLDVRFGCVTILEPDRLAELTGRAVG
jgi:CRP-like cAMP-binding protein